MGTRRGARLSRYRHARGETFTVSHLEKVICETRLFLSDTEQGESLVVSSYMYFFFFMNLSTKQGMATSLILNSLYENYRLME